MAWKSHRSRPAFRSEFPSGPYPKDLLKYRGDRLIEYETPANMEGLGTHSGLRKNGTAIRGAAILTGEPTWLISQKPSFTPPSAR